MITALSHLIPRSGGGATAGNLAFSLHTTTISAETAAILSARR